jgi:hypothetical protein
MTNHKLDISATLRSERPSGKCEVPLTPTRAFVDSRSGLLTLSLFIVFHLVAISNLSHDSDFYVFGDDVTVSAILTRAGLAPWFHVVQLHDSHHAFLTLAERDIGHWISLGRAGSLHFGVQISAANSDEVAHIFVGLVSRAHRTDPSADVSSEQHVEERVYHW